MTERVSALDASLLYLDHPTTPMHVGSVLIFTPPDTGFEHADLIALIRQRIAFAPRYRQRVKAVPLGLARPVWIDDVDFDITYHVRRSALPKPGTMAQLNELVGRLMSRPLDRRRPLWEMYLIEGLDDGRFALVTKTHQALVDGLASIDLVQVIMDASPDAQMTTSDRWQPRPEPSSVELMASAVTESIVHPSVAMDAAKASVHQIAGVAGSITGKAAELASSALSIAKPTASTPLNVAVGEHRRVATGYFSFDEFRDLHRMLGTTVNDVMLTVLTGALRSWLMGRGVGVTGRSQLRAAVPFSTSDSGSPVSVFLIDLPIGEPDPLVRLRQLAFETARLKDMAQLIGAESIISVAGLAPPTLHALGARLASNMSSRVFNLAVTNVPGPQRPYFLGGSRLIASYPIMPLTRNQALSIGITSYDGGVFVAANADHDALPDVDDLIDELRAALVELREAARN